MAFPLAQAYVEFGTRGVSTVMGAANAIKDKIFSVAAAITRPIRNLAGWVLNLLNPLNLLRSTLGKIAAAAGAVGVALSARGIAQAFATQEQAEMKLRGALVANGRAVEALHADYKAFASELQGITVVGDETTLGMLQTAESLGLTGEAAKTAVKEAIGLGRALGMSEKSAIRYTASLAEGDTMMLNRYMPALKEIEDQAERVAKAHEMLGKMFGVATEESQSTTGAYTQMKNAVGDVMEKIGETFAEVFDMRGRFKNVKEFAERFWDRFGVPIRNTFITIKTAANTAWDGIKAGFETVKDGVTALLAPWETSFRDTFKAITDQLDVMLGSWDGFESEIVNAAARTAVALEGIWEQLKNSIINKWIEIAAIAQTITEGVAALKDKWMPVLRAGLPDIPGGTPIEGSDKVKNAWKGLQLAIMAIRIQSQAAAQEKLLAQEEKFQDAMAELEKRAAEAREKAARDRAGKPKVSDKFGGPAAGEAGGAPWIGEPSWSPGADDGKTPKVSGARFGITSIAALADTMQQEAGRRMAERTASATERTADGVDEMVAAMHRQAAETGEGFGGWGPGALALHSPSIGG
jgi:hypothetical protein